MEEKNRKIHDLKTHLYSRKKKDLKVKRSKLKKEEINVENAWGSEDVKSFKGKDLYKVQKKKRFSIFALMFFLSLTFFVGAVSFASFLFLFDKNEVQSDISMSIVGPNSVKSGDVLEFFINLENPTKIDYRDIEFKITYPDSTIDSIDKDFLKYEDLRHDSILAGGRVSKKFYAILSGSENQEKEIKVKVLYKAGNFSNILFKEKIYTVAIESAPISVEIKSPKNILSEKYFEIEVDVVSNTNEVLEDLILEINYPIGFVKEESNPKSIFSNQNQETFKIVQLDPNQKENIRISGYLSGDINSDKFFFFKAGDSVPSKNQIRTVFAEKENLIAIKKPDIGISVSSDKDNEDGEIIAQAGSGVDLNILVQNNLENLISDVKIVTYIKSDLFENNTIKDSKGFYNSNIDKIIWDKNSDKNLQSINKNSRVSENFSFELKNLDNIAGYFKDPKIEIETEVFAKSLNSVESDSNLSEKITKVLKVPTQVDMKTEIFYEKGPFKNTGNINPESGKPTTYTVAWKISNSSSDIYDVELSAKLPPYVKYLEKTYPENSYISYNPDSREVNLKFNKIDAHIGYRTNPKTVYFQIEIIPSDNQIGSTPTLIKETTLKARDDFTKRDIEIFEREKTTKILEDSSRYDVGKVQ